MPFGASMLATLADAYPRAGRGSKGDCSSVANCLARRSLRKAATVVTMTFNDSRDV